MKTMRLFLSLFATCFQCLQADTILVQDDFTGTAGSPPNPAEFQTGGPTNLNGSGELILNTIGGVTSWVKSIESATPGASQTVVLQFRGYAYAEGWDPGIYGNGQPRGLRVGTDANNVIEFYSAARNLIGIRTKANGVETATTYAVTNVYDWHNYEIIVNPGSAVFKVDGATAATLTTNLPTGALNAHFTTSGPSNIPISLDSLSFFIQFASPSITSFTPTSGALGTSVTITGTNFTGTTAVKFGGVDATSFTVDSATQITGTVPTGAVTGPITVVTPVGSASSSGNFTVTVPTVKTLSSLSLSAGTLTPSFDLDTLDYTASVPHTTTSITITPTATDPLATVKVNGVTVASGSTSQPVALALGDNTVTVQVIAQDAIATRTYTLVVNRSTTLDAAFAAADTIPFTATSYTATGSSVNLSLGFVPPTGTNLTVVKNTGIDFITGQFSNLAQGQMVDLSYGGKSYRFVANYYGGTGNDLVLQWAYQDLAAWGYNYNGQLGNNSTTTSSVPVLVTQSGVLAGKTVVAVAAGIYHNLALCSDGTLAAWGYNYNGQLGNNSTTTSSVPVLVTQSGVLAGKTVVAVVAGYEHSLALCSDGTLAAWGANYYGQLGNNSMTDSSVPVLVTQSGVLAGKTVVAVAAGIYHNLALCSDGTLAAWGPNYYGQLGNNSTTASSVPVLVTQSGVLAGKTVVAVAAGCEHSLALCSDGTLAAWGANGYGQLGNNSLIYNSSVPVLVTQSGVLAGKTVVAIKAGFFHNLALCSDGTLAAWGDNDSGQLGNNSMTDSSVPVLVTQSGVLVGKAVVAVSAGDRHSLALYSDGTLAAWGDNGAGQLGNNSTTNSSVPVLVTQSGVLAGKAVVAVEAGAVHGLAIASISNSPDLVGLTLSSGALNPSFDAATTSYSASVFYTVASITVTPASAVNMAAVSVNGSPVSSGLASQSIPLVVGENTITIVVTAPDGVTTKTYMVTMTRAAPSSVSTLSDLVPGSGSLSPAFAAATTSYTCAVTNTISSITVRPTVTDATATVKVNGTTVASGTNSASIPLAGGANTITTVVTAQDGTTTSTYTITVTREENLQADFSSPNSIPVTVASYNATGSVVNLSLGFAPPVGTSLTVVKNTGLNFISGQFSNLAHGQTVEIAFGGTIYRFVANYYGGSGNDLVLEWPYRQAVAWGYNGYGQLGDGMTANRNVPVAVNQTGVLAGKTVVAVKAEFFHSLALCSDGTLAAWGFNDFGQLGNETNTSSNVPVAASQTGVLAGKTVVAVAGGKFHSLALCSDGTLAAWGDNGYGQLGDGTTANRNVPVAVNQTGVLAGKTVVAVAGGGVSQPRLVLGRNPRGLGS